MGVENHNAVLATTWDEKRVDALVLWISGLDDNEQGLFVFSESQINGYSTIILVPDGSKEGWDDSDKGDSLRGKFIARLREDEWEDGSSPWDWIEVGYGEYGQKVLRGNCVNCYSDIKYHGDAEYVQ